MMIKSVEEGSIADALGIGVGEKLLCINNFEIRDLIDYSYYMAESDLVLLIEDRDQELYEAQIEKEAYVDLGITFKEDGLGKIRTCANKCVFCFVDQMPKNMRETLYIKDDDWRQSFYTGNYITLTNLREKEIDRIITQRISPLYCSIHASDNDVRVQLMGNPKAHKSFARLIRLAKAGITIHTQIVMCEGLNDGAVLRQTLEDLYKLHPSVASVAVVPVGLTKYRDELYPLKPISITSARDAIVSIEQMQEKSMQANNTRFVYASDELYIKANLPLPEYDAYENFPQIENGVGLVAKLSDEVERALQQYSTKQVTTKRLALATGRDFFCYLKKIVSKVQSELPVQAEVYCIKNNFFGKSITVAGLLTGKDLVEQLKEKIQEDVLLLPSTMFREGTDMLLDNMSLEELSAQLNIPVKIVPSDGFSLVESLIN